MKFRKIAIVAMILLLMSSGCKSSWGANNWAKNTSDILQKSQGKDGGYSLLVNERGVSLYNTYYNLLIIKTYGDYSDFLRITNLLKANIIKYPVNTIKTQNDLRDLDYLVSIYRILELPIGHDVKTNIRTQIMSLQCINDGLFKLSQNEDVLQSLINTELAVNILDGLGIKGDNTRLNDTLTELYRSGQIDKITDEYIYTIYDSVDNILRKTGISYYEQEEGLNKRLQLIDRGKTVLLSTPSSPLDFINYFALYHLLQNLGIKSSVSVSVVNYMNFIRLNDGGFNLLRDDVSDPQITFQFYMLYPDNLRPNISQYLNKMMKYRLDNGFYTDITPIKSNIRNSFMAMIIYKNMDYTVPKELVKYFNSMDNNLSALDVYYLNKARRELNILPYTTTENVTKALNDILMVESQDKLYNLINLIETHNLSDDQKKTIKNYIHKFKNKDGGYGVKNISDFITTYLAIQILDEINYPDQSHRLKNWILSQQKLDGGFSLRTSSSDLVDTFYALQIFKAIKFKPEELDRIDQYLEGLKLSSGGFSYFEGSNKMSITATYFGCESEKVISNWRQ